MALYRVWQAALVTVPVWAHIATSSLLAQAITLPAAAAAASEAPPPPALVASFAASAIMTSTEAASAASAAAPAAAQTAAVAVAATVLSPRPLREWRDQPSRRRRASDDHNRDNSGTPAAYSSVTGGGGRGRPAEASGEGSVVRESLTTLLPLADERAPRWESDEARGGEEAEARAAGGVSVVEAVGKAGRAGEGRRGKGEGIDVANGDQHQRKGLRCTENICGGGRHRGAAVSGDLGLVGGEAGLETARYSDLEFEGQVKELREVNVNKARAEQHFLRTVDARRTETQALVATATAPGAAEREDADAERWLPPHERSGKVGGARVEDVVPLTASSKPFSGPHGGGGLRPARRRAADEVKPSPHNEHEEGDDEAVDGFGSVGLLAFVVCFGILFCVMEVAKCYLLWECRRRQQSRRQREEDAGSHEGQMPLADSRPVAPAAPPAGSKEDWVEVLVDGVSIGAKLPGDKNAKDVPSARGYAVADASHALQEAIEHAERMSPSRGSRVVFTVPPPPRSSLPRSSPTAGGPASLASPRRGLTAPAPSHGAGEGHGREV